MDSKTYLVESARTLSPNYDADKVSGNMARFLIDDARAVGDALNFLRAALFYGKANHLTIKNLNYTNFSDVYPDVEPTLLHAALGVISEGVELLEAVLKPGKEVDKVNLLEEGGDIEWFMAAVYRWLDQLPEDARERNIAKLRARYPGKFNTEDYSNRDLANERAALSK